MSFGKKWIIIKDYMALIIAVTVVIGSVLIAFHYLM